MAAALEVINADPAVKSIFVNIFGGITRVDEVAKGIIEALGRVDITSPIVLRLDGTNAEQGRALLAPHLSDTLHGRADHARRRPPSRRPGRRARSHVPQGATVSIFVDENTNVVIQGISPTSQGLYHGLRNRAYGTKVVAGTNPKRGGEDDRGHPGLRHRGEAVEATGATASFISVPPPHAAAAILEAAEAGIGFVVCITEGIPAQDEALTYNRLVEEFPGTRLLGPNCPGHHLPGEVQHRHHLGRHRPARRSGRHRQPLRHADVPGAARAVAAGRRPDDVRRHRWRPGTGHELHRLPRRVPGRPRHQGRHDDRRDRWLRGGAGGRVHRRQGDQAGRRPTSPA